MHKVWPVCLVGAGIITLFARLPLCSASAADFYAYYTAIPSSEPFARNSRTGDDADLIVKLGQPEGKLVFWRGTSYLPYWETKQGKWSINEMIPRHGDGPDQRPDQVNSFSHVALIESTPHRVLISWRYLPEFAAGNPHPGVDPSHFVEELFEVHPDGKVVRTIRQGTADVVAWNDPLNEITQEMQLSADGVRETSRQAANRSPVPGPVVGNPISNEIGITPVCAWRFNEGRGDDTVESVTGTRCHIEGPKALWRKGVSGTALAFDGYNTEVVLPAAQAPVTGGGSLTLEAWVALGAYPWNWVPLVQQGDDTGFFLGVDSHGYPGFNLKVDGVWQELSVPNHPPYHDTNHLQLSTWYQVAGTYDRTDGMMRLYVNGHEIAAKLAGKGGVQSVSAPVRVGKAGIKRVPTEGTHDTLPSGFGLDGLIDEVRIYNQALTGEQVATTGDEAGPNIAPLQKPDLEPRHFPVPTSPTKFGAIYTHLPYYETWENLFRFGRYPDVVVGFDQLPTKFVFWRGVSFIPMMVNETNQWFTEEFNETGGTAEAPGDCEPMSDKPCYHSHVRVIENNNARVVVQWRYYLENPDHQWANYDAATGWGDVANWYFYIYPDGVATVRMHLYTSRPNTWHEWDEQIAVFGEGQHPETVIRRQPVMTLVNWAGQATTYDWNPNPPNPSFASNLIQMIHFTGQYSPFAIQDFDGGDIYSGERTWYSVFPTWNHWPTAQVDSSGRNASFPDRASHSSISHLFWPIRAESTGNVPFQEKVLMEGMSRQPPEQLLPLAKSWLRPAALTVIKDCRHAGYDAAQRAYVLVATGPEPTFSIAASADHPLFNPAFVIRDWNVDSPAEVSIDGVVQPEGPAVRQGVVYDSNGRALLVAWLERQATTPTVIRLRGAQSDMASSRLLPVGWTVPPRPGTAIFSAEMQATPSPEVGTEYFFECVTGPGHNSGWIQQPEYIDRGLPPEAQVTYRVKALNIYLTETDWSSSQTVRMSPAPPPVVWKLREGTGELVRDLTGKFEGKIVGGGTWIDRGSGKALHLGGAESCGNHSCR